MGTEQDGILERESSKKLNCSRRALRVLRFLRSMRMATINIWMFSLNSLKSFRKSNQQISSSSKKQNSIQSEQFCGAQINSKFIAIKPFSSLIARLTDEGIRKVHFNETFIIGECK